MGDAVWESRKPWPFLSCLLHHHTLSYPLSLVVAHCYKSSLLIYDQFLNNLASSPLSPHSSLLLFDTSLFMHRGGFLGSLPPWFPSEEIPLPCCMQVSDSVFPFPPLLFSLQGPKQSYSLVASLFACTTSQISSRKSRTKFYRMTV